MNHLNHEKIALTINRLMLGIIFTAHGSQKVLGWFGGPGLSNFATWLASLGVPAWLGYLAAFAEFFGGVLLLLGIAAQLGAVMVIPVMIGAIAIVHWSHGFFSQNGGYEYPLALSVFLLAVIIGGPGYAALWKFPKIND